MAEAQNVNTFQFKISLKGTKPKVWRRIQVPEDFTFWEFHVAIADVMGWRDYHLHQFHMKNNVTIGNPVNTFDSDDSYMDESTVKLCDYFKNPSSKATYEYDFGDSWEHELLLEKILPPVAGASYPQCLAGKRACPPEDCGGVCGYEDLLEIIADKKHKEYQEMQEWVKEMKGDNFNPETFDPKAVVFRDAIELKKNKVNF